MQPSASSCTVRGATALQCAATGSDRDLVIELLGKGADIDAAPVQEDGRTALEAAAENRRLDIVCLFLKKNPNRSALEVKCKMVGNLASKKGKELLLR
jgi:ankyrin repeat protein